MKKIISLLLMAVLALGICVCGFFVFFAEETQLAPAAEAGATDYSDPYNWIICDYDNSDKKDTQVDVIFFYGTCVNNPYYDDGSTQIDDTMKTAVSGMYEGAADVFDDGTRMYIPCYRQIALMSALQNETHSGFLNQIKASLAAQDLYAALDYYFANYNEGRPFILAGYSQGGACTQIVLEEYFGREDNKAYLDRMVVCYSVAFGVDKKLIEDNDYLKFATGATDTGVIASWNTEGPGDKVYSLLLADNPADTLVINPINWKTDATPALASESLGSYIDGEIVTPGVYNLQYDPERGSLICDNNTNYVTFGDLVIFGGKSLHLVEISQAYADIRQNMHDRIEAFMKNSKIETTSENYDIKPLTGEALDYSDSGNWLKYDENPENEVDLFYIYPTVVWQSTDETGLAQINDEHKAAAMNAYNGQGSAFADYTNVYAPMYRQSCIDKALSFMGEGNGGTEGFVDFLSDNLPRTDIYAALDYYFNNVNNGRPFILAGHSQGSSMSSIVLSEYFRVHPELLERMVACYAIGFPFSDEWLANNPHLKFATGELDTGCIISWNTEGPGATLANACIGVGHAYNINPLNWKTDDTYAAASENLGSLIDGELVVGFGDAQIDPERGALICTTYEEYCPESMSAMMGDKSLHTVDYQMYYGNIKENGKKRIEAYLAKEKASMATDYTKAENWAVFENDGTEAVDTIFFCPSLVFSSVTGTGLALPEEMLTGIDTVLKGQAAVFEDSTNVYVPLYRQQVFNAEVLSAMDMSDPVHWMFDYYRTHAAYEDCAAALDYYFENYNNGKPFILAGHSQGSILVHLILEKYMSEHPEYYERMVAAYAIGMSTPKDFMEANPHLKYATGADDTGVIISYNTEGPDAEGDSFLLCEGSYLINPINWKTDDTYAPATDNLGSYVNGEIVMNFADAQIDFERYAIVSAADCSYGEMVAYTGTKCLHGSDYQIYMNNLKENVKVRIEAFLAQ